MWTDLSAIGILARAAPNGIIASKVIPLTVRNYFHLHWVPRTNLDFNYYHKSANLARINIQFRFSCVTNMFRKITSHFCNLTSWSKIRIFMIGHCAKPRTFQCFLIDILSYVTSIVFIYPLIYEFYLRTHTQTNEPYFKCSYFNSWVRLIVVVISPFELQIWKLQSCAINTAPTSRNLSKPSLSQIHSKHMSDNTAHFCQPPRRKCLLEFNRLRFSAILICHEK